MNTWAQDLFLNFKYFKKQFGKVILITFILWFSCLFLDRIKDHWRDILIVIKIVGLY